MRWNSMGWWIAWLILSAAGYAQDTARGSVFLDENGNGRRDSAEKGLGIVCVSNGADVAVTDAEGRWALPAGAEARLFVIQPAGYAAPLDNAQAPQYYHLREAGAPLPESLDFPLLPGNIERRFTALFFGDTQARGLREVDFVTHDVVEEAIGSEAAFGVALGDMVADDPALFAEISQSIAQIGKPWHYILGNHDYDRAATTEAQGDDTFERFFGPSTYAFEHGQAVFIALRNVYNAEERSQQRRFTEEQLAFVGNYLRFVPEDKLIVLMMHAPLPSCSNAEAMYRLIETRPHTFSISAHAHEQFHLFLGEAQGWRGAKPHHHLVSATVCGSWWCGLQDELGIPHATMNDGAPNGYLFIDFDSADYRIRFKAARRPEDYQMNIYAPSEIESAKAGASEVLVNVFAGSEKSTVEMRFGKNGAWTPLEFVRISDPECQRMFELSPYLDQEVLGKKLDEVLGWKMDEPSKSRHMWKGMLPQDPPPGTHTLTVRTTDLFGQLYTAHRIVRIR